jgi:hypothetical protein
MKHYGKISTTPRFAHSIQWIGTLASVLCLLGDGCAATTHDRTSCDTPPAIAAPSSGSGSAANVPPGAVHLVHAAATQIAGTLVDRLAEFVVIAVAVDEFDTERGVWPRDEQELGAFAKTREIPLNLDDFQSIEFVPSASQITVNYQLKLTGSAGSGSGSFTIGKR